MSVLRLDHVSRSFGRLVVTNDVSLAVERGECHAIIGPNGAGKTSLVNQIAGQFHPDAGGIFVKDVEVTRWPPHRISRIGVARTFQKNNLFGNLSVLENVRLAVQARTRTRFNPFVAVRSLASLKERAEEILHMVRLDQGHARLVRDLSYGEQRQLEIGVALAGEPDLLLLDEPTSGMSQAETSRITALIPELPAGLAVLMIEHDMDVVFSLADRITVLYYGEVLATGTPAEIQGNARVREVYLGVAH
jgi:branched-chain amino acid transport system ATP-binding protein